MRLLRKEVHMYHILDISKAFDKVWHEGLLFKLKPIGIGGPLLNWFQTYLVGRLQRVIIKGQESTWLPITAGVPQGSILGPLLFLFFINDLPQGIESNVDLFADDTSILDIVDNPTSTANKLNRDLEAIHDWALNKDFASYLKPLLPTSAMASNYNLRNKDLLVLHTKDGITNRFANSFVHASIKIWNSLPLEIRRIEKTNSFKSALSNYYAFQPPAKAPKYFASGLRPASVLQSRLRYRFSALNAHFYTHNIVADPSCSCGHDW